MPLEDVASARTPTTSVRAEDAAVLKEPATKKQKQEVEVPEPTPGPRSFKTIGKVVLAMKRFQAALNPTYEYGKVKHPIHPPGPRHVRTPSPTSLSTGSELEEAVHPASHGRNRASILFGKLPDVPSEAQ